MEKSDRKSKKKHKSKTVELLPMASYVNDRPALLAQLFSALPSEKMLAMLPPVLRDVPHDELRADCLEILLGLSARRVRGILRGEQLGSSSSSETDSQSEASRESSPNRQPANPPSPVPGNDSRSLLEIVELQLRARAIRAALNHGDDGGPKEPSPQVAKNPTTPPLVAPSPVKEVETIAEPVVESKISRTKKRPVLVGPLKGLGKRLLLSSSHTYPMQSSTKPTAAKDESMEGKRMLSLANSVKAQDQSKEQKKDLSIEGESCSDETVVETMLGEQEVDLIKQVTAESPEFIQDETNPSVAEQGKKGNSFEDLQPVSRKDSTWVDRRLQQAASPTLRSSIIGSTRQRLTNIDKELSPEANGSKTEPNSVGNHVDANEGSVLQYASLVSNALEPEPLVLNYEED